MASLPDVRCAAVGANAGSDGILIPSATQGTQSVQLRGLYVPDFLVIVINPAGAGASTLTVSCQGVDTSGNLYSLGSSAALAASTIIALQFGPGFPTTANVSFNVMVPTTVLVTATVSAANISYGVNYITG